MEHLLYSRIAVKSIDQARAYDAQGNAVNGHLAVDKDGRLVFVRDDGPAVEPGRES